MEITAKHVKALVAAEVTADSHHSSIKKIFKAAFDHTPDKEEIAAIRTALSGTADPPSPADLLDQAQSYLKGLGQKETRLISVTEVTASGSPARVIVRCVEPQTNGNGDSVCAGEREVAIQDVFQVVRCVPCQKRSVQIYRNRLARARRQELRERRASQ